RSDELISQLNQQINGSLEHPVLHESLSSAVAGRLSARLATDRRTLAYQARGYLLTETPEAMQRLEASYSELEQLSQQLQSNPSLSSDARISLANAIESTASYMDALRELPALVNHQSQARDTMDQAYSDLHQRTLELAGIQNQLLSEKISESRIATVVLSLIALMLAILIAWYITRQIVQPLNTAVEIAKALGNRDMTSSGVETRGDEFGTLLQ
ncbi:MAG: methyl-accepting chemotaxis protein, partial [Thiopseudomonas sp.]